ncbi:MAG: cysteine--tRNA ligase [Candidatus Micrarchaeota archaeon]|nr:cysteine--tRNA ligase [Candidatus Micrarchaeota archaeon]
MIIYDSFEAREREFIPVKDGHVRMYVCGLTPYDKMHIGHLRTYVFFDVVRRYFESKGFEVLYVQNITDVEDKVFQRAAELGIHPLKLTEMNMKKALEEMDALNIKRPTLLEKVSDNVPAIISLIEKIIENGYGYESSGDVYFSVLKFKGYGKLSKQKIDELMSGARVEPGEKKHNPLDFALWKSSKENEVVFDSPWGKGRPGWHIECSAIASKYVGGTLDIHGGGRDLIFPHHENEIAQSEAATGHKFVNFWMHTGFLTINGEKMSKSLNNFITAEDVLSRYDANVIRWYLLTRHYRSPIDFSFEGLDETKKHIEKMMNAIEFARVAIERPRGTDDSIESEVEAQKKAFHDAMEHDFNTANALVAINELIRIINKSLTNSEVHPKSLRKAVDVLIETLGILGIKVSLKQDDAYIKRLEGICKEHGISTEDGLFIAVEKLLSARESLRKGKRYADADKIRSALAASGIVVEDIGGTSLWRRG